jgi:subtilisin family serine protease
LFVVAAGNAGQDNDATAHYLCNYDRANVVCVAAGDRNDSLAVFSDYGATNGDLAAPGVGIVSTWPRNRFVRLDGTSMATPHVSGAAALLLARHAGLDVVDLRAALLAGGDAGAGARRPRRHRRPP